MLRTIKSERDIDSLFQRGTRVVATTCSILVQKTPHERGHHGRVIFIAGKKMGSAVLRNRCKRVLRVAVGRCGGPWDGWDVAILARQTTASAGPGRIDRDLRSLLKKAGVLDEPPSA